MKSILYTAELGYGNKAWVERTAYGAIAAKADFHPDDPIHTMLVGTARQCFGAVSSTARALRANRLGKVQFRRNH